MAGSKWSPEMQQMIDSMLKSGSASEEEPSINAEFLKKLKQEAKTWHWENFFNTLNALFPQLELHNVTDVDEFMRAYLAYALGGPGYHRNKIFQDFYFVIKPGGYGGRTFVGILIETVKSKKDEIKSILENLLKEFGLADIVIGGRKIIDLVERINPEYKFADHESGDRDVKAVEYEDSSLRGVLTGLADKNKFLNYAANVLPSFLTDKRQKTIKSRLKCDDGLIEEVFKSLSRIHSTIQSFKEGKTIDRQYFEYVQGQSEIADDLNRVIDTANLFLVRNLRDQRKRSKVLQLLKTTHKLSDLLKNKKFLSFLKEHKKEKELRKTDLDKLFQTLKTAYEGGNTKYTSRPASENVLCRIFINVLKECHMYLPGINPYNSSFFNNPVLTTKEQILKKVNELEKKGEIMGETMKMLVVLYLFLKVWGGGSAEILREKVNEFNNILRWKRLKHPTATIFKIPKQKLNDVEEAAISVVSNL